MNEEFSLQLKTKNFVNSMTQTEQTHFFPSVQIPVRIELFINRVSILINEFIPNKTERVIYIHIYACFVIGIK